MNECTSLEPREVLNLTVNDLLHRWPAAIQLFLAFRLGCIGCVYNRFDTLREALEAQEVNERDFLRSLFKTIFKTDFQRSQNSKGAKL